MTNNNLIALSFADRWNGFWQGNIGVWILERGVPIALLLIGGLLAARFISWGARRIVRRIDAEYQESDQLVRTESAKHRQAVASVISWVSVALLFVVVAVEISDILAIPISSLVAPAAVLGAALGFGAQKLVQDLLAGFFIITERQYGFGDLVQVNMLGAPDSAEGTVEEVTLRVTKLRTERRRGVHRSQRQHRALAEHVQGLGARGRSTCRCPSPPTSTRSTTCCTASAPHAMEDVSLRQLLLDEPALMGVESIEVDTVNVRIVARTLPGKQFEVGRRLRIRVIAALTTAGIVSQSQAQTTSVEAIAHPATVDAEVRNPRCGGADEMTSRFKAKFGRMRVSTLVLLVAFVALFWVDQTFQPPAPCARACRSCRRASCPTRTTRGCRARTCDGPRRPCDDYDDDDDHDHDDDQPDGLHAVRPRRPHRSETTPDHDRRRQTGRLRRRR